MACFCVSLAAFVSLLNPVYPVKRWGYLVRKPVGRKSDNIIVTMNSILYISYINMSGDPSRCLFNRAFTAAEPAEFIPQLPGKKCRYASLHVEFTTTMLSILFPRSRFQLIAAQHLQMLNRSPLFNDGAPQ